MIIIIYRCVIILLEHICIDQLPDRLMRQIWIDCTGSVADQCCKMMYLSWFTCFQYDCDRCSLLRPYQMLLKPGQSKQRRHCNVILIYTTVRKDQNIGALMDRTVYLDEQIIYRLFQTGILIIDRRDLRNLEAILFHILDLQKIRFCKNRIIHLKHLTVFLFFLQKVAVFSNIYRCGGYHFLPDGINRWIRNLCKQLFEISKEILMLIGQYRKWCINTHGGRSLCSVLCHAQDRSLHFFIRITKRLLKPLTFFRRIGWNLLIRNLQIFQFYQIAVQPFAVWLSSRICLFQFFIIDYFSLYCIYQ